MREHQIVTYWYRELFIFFVVSEQIATGKKSWNLYRQNLVPGKSLEKIWYLKKVSEPVSGKFGTGTDFCLKNLGIFKIYNGYRYRLDTGTGIFHFFLRYRNRYRKNLVPELIFIAKI